MRDYPMIITPLSDKDGGGYKVEFPDLPGCISDGETPEEAARNGQDAKDAWLEVQAERGAEVPEPGNSLAQHRARRERLTMLLHAMTARQEQLHASYEELLQELARADAQMDESEARMAETQRLLNLLKDHLGLDEWGDLPHAVGSR